MEKYRILFRKSVSRDLRRIPIKDIRKILQTVESLSENPRPPGSEKLSGQEKYRIWQGDYRIVYEIRDKEIIVVVVKIAHRRDAYRH
jgi:mRNA interferase RelE/StbE